MSPKHIRDIWSRRQFLRAGAMASVPLSIVGRIDSEIGKFSIPFLLQDNDVAAAFEAVMMAALDSATRKGATYADVNMHISHRENWFGSGDGMQAPYWSRGIGIGVRALVDGCWGFSGRDGTPESIEIGADLGQQAAQQASVTARELRQRAVELVALPRGDAGHWTMPIGIDPFEVDLSEKADFFSAICDDIQRRPFGIGVNGAMSFLKQTRLFVSTDGAKVVQTVYNTGAELRVDVGRDWKTGDLGELSADFVTTVGAGWEYIRSVPFRENADRLIAAARAQQRRVPVEVGRYDIVLDAAATARLLDMSIGIATELDRALGCVANSLGTSFVRDPLNMLGQYHIGSPLLNVTTNRSMALGAATVKWDEEGVLPEEAALVKDGLLVDMQTTRETAVELAPYYRKIGRPVKSNGCAGVYSATRPVTTRSPNFIMSPSHRSVSFDDLVQDTRKGIAFLGGYSKADYQALNGYGAGVVAYEIVNGAIGRPIRGAQFLFHNPEIWKGLVAIGGQESSMRFGQKRAREWSELITQHTVSAVPAKFTGVAITDITRRT